MGQTLMPSRNETIALGLIGWAQEFASTPFEGKARAGAEAAGLNTDHLVFDLRHAAQRIRELEKAGASIAYALSRVQTDPDFRWHMMHTETMARLVHAEAVFTGESEEEVMKRRQEWGRKSMSPADAQLPKARERIELLERLLDEKGIPLP